jgi:arylsulfatase A-like enzyme
LADFSDVMPTCLELAGAETPARLDGVSFARQLQGQPGQPRQWVHSLYADKFFVRDAQWKLRENGELYDVTGSPFTEILILAAQDTVESKSARRRLQAVLNELHPAGPSASQTPVPEAGSIPTASRRAEGCRRSACRLCACR